MFRCAEAGGADRVQADHFFKHVVDFLTLLSTAGARGADRVQADRETAAQQGGPGSLNTAKGSAGQSGGGGEEESGRAEEEAARAENRPRKPGGKTSFDNTASGVITI